MCRLLSGREDLLPGVAAATEREAGHRPGAEWGEGTGTRSFSPHSPRPCPLCADIAASTPAQGFLRIQGQSTSNLSLSVQIVKFARGPHAKVSPVNDVDVGVYQLMQSEQLLSRKVESLSQEAER